MRRAPLAPLTALLAALGCHPSPRPAAATAEIVATNGCGGPAVSEAVRADTTLEAPLPATTSPVAVTPPREGWELGRVTWVAAGRDGLVYLLQRGDKADPVVVVNRDGHVVRTWGAGAFTLPHSIRVDSAGDVWTVDARTSMVTRFTPDGRAVMTIDVGAPAGCAWQTRGATDVAFAPNGHVYVADGYANARVLEFTPEGRKVREWGHRGRGPGELWVPHSIVVDASSTVIVADRENSRIQRFTADGRFLDAWPIDGKPSSLALQGGTLWIGALRVAANGTRQPILVRVDARTGRVIARYAVPGGHGLGILPDGRGLLVDAGRTAQLVQLPAR